MSEKGTSLSTKVLFIVYRVEWWGCLDSLCRQECLKEDTDVYVMPVPRYDWDLRTMQLDAKKSILSRSSWQQFCSREPKW